MSQSFNEFDELSKWFNKKYFEEISSDDRDNLNILFKHWITGLIGEKSQLYNIFKILHEHEHSEVKNICLNAVKTFLPSDKINEFIKYWIYDPINELADILESIVQKQKRFIPDGLLCLYYLSAHRFHELEKLDPNLQILSEYIQKLDKNFARPLLLKYNNYINRDSISYLKNFRYFYAKDIDFSHSSNLSKFEVYKLSRNWRSLWEICKIAPIPLSVEILKILLENDWYPDSNNEKQLFDNLRECWGNKGWKGIIKITQLLATYSDEERFMGINFEWHLNPEIYTNPYKFKVDFDPLYSPSNCLIHIPNYDFTIMQDSINYFESLNLLNFCVQNKDLEKILELTIQNSKNSNFFSNIEKLKAQWDNQTKALLLKSEDFSFLVDIPLLNILYRPISQSYTIVEDYLYLAALLERINSENFFILKGIVELIKRNIGYPRKMVEVKKKLNLFKKESLERAKKSHTESKKYNIGIDFGHSTTIIVFLDDRDELERIYLPIAVNNKNENDIGNIIPSIIHYDIYNKFTIGKKAFSKSRINDEYTFYKMKRYINEGWRQVRVIQGKEINASQAATDFLISLFNCILEKINKEQIVNINFTIPINSSPEYEAWIKQTINNIKEIYNINKINFHILKEGLSACIEICSKTEIEAPFIIIDIGAQTTDIAIIDILNKSSGEISVFSSVGDDLGGDDVDRIIYEYVIENLLKFKPYIEIDEFNERILYTCERAKINLSHKPRTDLNFPNYIKEAFINSDTQISLERNLIEDLIAEEGFYEKLQELLEKAIKQAENNLCSVKNLNNIILIGGTAKWPGVSQFLRDNFPKKNIISEDLSFITALGATKFSSGVKINNLTRFDYGIILTDEQNSKKFFNIISFNLAVPFGIKTWKLEINHKINHLMLDLWRKKEILSDKKERKEIFYDDKGYLHIKPGIGEKILFESLFESPKMLDLHKIDLDNIFLSIYVSDDLKLQIKIHDNNSPNINVFYELNDIITIS